MQTKRREEIARVVRKEQRQLERWSWIRLLSLIVLVVGIVFTFLLRPSRVEGNSMHPNLDGGDIGITNVIYGIINKVERFDVVEIYDPEQSERYIKRVIGLPGEIVQYRDDVLYINGEVKDEYFLDNSYMKETKKSTDLFTNDFGPIKLQADEYFVCGDNRVNSLDSRSFGAVNKKNILSVGFLRIFH